MHSSPTRRLLSSAGLCALAASQAAAASPRHPSTVFIPYSNVEAGQTQLTASPALQAGFNGGRQFSFTMDTGSTGIVVSPDNFTPPSGATPIGTGTISYTSSGRILSGDYYMTEVQIGAGAASATAKVPVLRVLQETCAPKARDCQKASPPTGVAMMGVGFGGTHDTPPNGTPEMNPFLHIIQIAGRRATPEAGYVVTSQGVTLGITPATARHFRQVPLTWNATYKDWNRAPATVEAHGWTGTGIVLVDTGVPSMYLQPATGDTVPTIPKASAVAPCIQYAPCAAPGVTVRIKIGLAGAAYAFKVGPDGIPETKQPAAPGWVTVEKATSADVFVNTSYHFLNKFDMMYDYTFGVVGFRVAKHTAAAGD